jgi:hypothetical protein
MTEVQRSTASLRFIGDDLVPDEISARLGASPSISACKGGVLVTPKGRETVARSGIWTLKAPADSSGNLDGQLKALFAGLNSDLGAWQEIAGRYNGHVFSGLFLKNFNEGTTLTPQALSMLGARGLALDLDIYGAGDEE